MSLGTSNRDGGKTSESGHLRAIGKMITGEVLVGLDGSQRAAGVNMSVDIAIGDAIIPRADGSYGHPVFNDAAYNQVISAADGSNPRRDIVVIYVDYGQSPSTAVSNNVNGVVKIKVVNGTAAGSPVDPTDAAIQSSVGSGNPYAKLCRVRVPAGQTSISNSLIDDMRSMAQALQNNGWQQLSSAWDFWAYASGTTITVPSNATTKHEVGQFLRFWQTTGGWKFAEIIGVTSTVLTIRMATGQTLANERIYLPSYSFARRPFGLPSSLPNGEVVQRVFTAPTAQVTGSTILPVDDTKPQNTEGTEFMTLAITPKSTTNLLTIEVVALVGSNTAGRNMAAALFQDSVADAIAANAEYNDDSSAIIPTIVEFNHAMLAGTVSPTTFKVRAGAHAAATYGFNGNSSNRLFGDITKSSIIITETRA